jgi:hypothetical protein
MTKSIDTLRLAVKRRWWFGCAVHAVIAYARITKRMPPKWVVPALCRYGIRIEVAR